MTDLDSVDGTEGKACAVHEGVATSNACIKRWFEDDHALATLTQRSAEEKISGGRRLAYEISETANGPCGRTFEDAFMLANQTLFALTATTANDLEKQARERASGEKKSAFALKYAIEVQEWKVPRYIHEGLQWLAGKQSYLNDPDPQLQMLAETTAAPVAAAAGAA